MGTGIGVTVTRFDCQMASTVFDFVFLFDPQA